MKVRREGLKISGTCPMPLALTTDIHSVDIELLIKKPYNAFIIGNRYPRYVFTNSL